ncbi:hypothetical protein FOXYSP1_08257 [Fusarium oxysporum f. sp. phaseoli]
MRQPIATQSTPIESSHGEEWYLPDKMLARHSGKPHTGGRP